ncbi:MAG: preprotein translocase subunit SecG [Gammaproteobacteria bacterium]|nr:MAG: preprotein translocase subunit SecG [Gammaproteobacteria bacterium]UCH40986.1 MAG: preprotein translocase subunit SecG [Gammaproteobacteria bacterium]
MENLNSILLVVQVLLSISLIALILLQHGKGADAGAAFGSGASATVFGARGSGNFLSRMTTIIAILFFIVCLALAYISSNRVAPDSVTGSVTAQEIEPAPAAETEVMQEADLPPAEGGADSAMDADLPPAE